MGKRHNCDHVSPGNIYLVVGAIIWLLDDRVSCYQRVIFFILLPLLGPFATAFATPAYIFYVVFVFVRKLKDPSYVSNHADFFFRMNAYRGKSRFAQPADLLKVVEALSEADIQAIIGTCLLHNQYFSRSVYIIVFPKIIYFSSFSSLCALEQRCRIRQLHNLLLPNWWTPF